MSRPGAWNRVVTNIWKYVKGDFSKKNYVAQDESGNRFYEISNSRQNVSRGFDPPSSGSHTEPNIEWQAWLRGTRRFPPSENEIALNRMRQQAQLTQDSSTEKRASNLHPSGAQDAHAKPQKYPKYKDLETAPGVKDHTKDK